MKKLNKIKENNVRSLIRKDQLCLRFAGRRGVSENRFVSPFIKNYDNFKCQTDALGETRKYRRIAKKADEIGQQQSEKFFYANYGTRDLVWKTDFEEEVNLVEDDFNFDIQLEIEDAFFSELEQPPPIKNSLISNVNLTARLLPSPTFTSA